jgi:hypothetical protein
MMVLSARRPDPSLLEFLATRARSASLRRLTVDSFAGVALVAAVLRWHSSVQVVAASAAVCLSAYGVWGLLDRAAAIALGRDNGRIAGAIGALQTLAALVGVLAAVSGLLGVWALALGTWIS